MHMPACSLSKEKSFSHRIIGMIDYFVVVKISNFLQRYLVSQTVPLDL